jgi:hypothetical protein
MTGPVSASAQYVRGTKGSVAVACPRSSSIPPKSWSEVAGARVIDVVLVDPCVEQLGHGPQLAGRSTPGVPGCDQPDAQVLGSEVDPQGDEVEAGIVGDDGGSAAVLRAPGRSCRWEPRARGNDPAPAATEASRASRAVKVDG